MVRVSNVAIDLIEAGAAQRTPAAVGRAFFGALNRFGVRALHARTFGVPHTPGTERVLSRISPPGWEEMYAERGFALCNPLPRATSHRADPFRWSDIPLHTDAERELLAAAAAFGFPNGLAVPCHGPHGYQAVVSLGFEQLSAVAPAERTAIEVAAAVLHGHMRACLRTGALPASPLSVRERDCLSFVAEGKSDGEIAAVLGISATTVATHVQGARRKLGARTRAQAVASLFAVAC